MLGDKRGGMTPIARLNIADLDWATDFLTHVFLVGAPITKLFFAAEY